MYETTDEPHWGAHDAVIRVQQVGELKVDSDVANKLAVVLPSEDAVNSLLVHWAICNTVERERGVSFWGGKERVDQGEPVVAC